VELIEPAGGANDEVHAQRRDTQGIAVHRGGNRKIDGDVDAAKVLRRESFEVRVIKYIQLERHLKTEFRRETLDEYAHPAVADDGKLARFRHGRPHYARTRLDRAG